jgi:alkylation response protein AidB-like acyl-CoA dehydrogenase
MKNEKPILFAEPDPDIVGRALNISERLKQRAAEADRARELPVENMRDLHEAELLTLNIPLELGGAEADLITQMAVYEIIGGACASTAWCLGNHSVMCTRFQGMLGNGPNP